MTRKQAELLRFLEHRAMTGDVTPSFDEMREALRLKSKSGIHRLITSLEEQGLISRDHYRARRIKVLQPSGPVAVAEFHSMVQRLAQHEGSERAFAALVEAASKLLPSMREAL